MRCCVSTASKCTFPESVNSRASFVYHWYVAEVTEIVSAVVPSRLISRLPEAPVWRGGGAVVGVAEPLATTPAGADRPGGEAAAGPVRGVVDVVGAVVLGLPPVRRGRPFLAVRQVVPVDVRNVWRQSSPPDRGVGVADVIGGGHVLVLKSVRQAVRVRVPPRPLLCRAVACQRLV